MKQFIIGSLTALIASTLLIILAISLGWISILPSTLRVISEGSAVPTAGFSGIVLSRTTNGEVVAGLSRKGVLSRSVLVHVDKTGALGAITVNCEESGMELTVEKTGPTTYVFHPRSAGTKDTTTESSQD